ncbi:MAG: hypothetical protein A3J72_08795 [Nitrospirae bacterium RIFCSPHIGHO2_02_FULL_40_19]|nr:MAG: hypothetical protein A3J72_08795 [Nitrospirae bacterium RIFCSPHIGHO2_02_FULL_40_19]
MSLDFFFIAIQVLHESYQFFKAPFELDESLYLIEFLEEFKMMNPVRIIVPVNKTMLVST